MAEKSPDEFIASALEQSRNIKFGRGVVSKTSYVAALVVCAWIAIAWRWSEAMTSNLGLLFAGLVVTAFGAWYIKSSQDFAERNPGQALLDGAEFLEYTKLGAATKSLPAPPDGQPLVELPPARGHGK